MGTPFFSVNPGLWQNPISGVYERRDFGRVSGPSIQQFVEETVRLDVDGWYPQKMASGSFFGGILASELVEWVADIVETSPGVWEGFINGRWVDRDLLPHRRVKIVAPQTMAVFTRAELTITFHDGAPSETRTVYYVSPYFRSAEIEWDIVQDATRVTRINTGDHPNRPSTLQVGPLSLIEVFSRAGVDLQRSPNESVVPLALSDPDGEGSTTWSDFELDQAMKKYWSRYKGAAQWSMWLLFAGLHDDALTRGIMFDHQGTFKRQGAAVFNDWWDTDGATGNFENLEAHIRRRMFVTACHETGHCFNLIHSHESAAGGNWRTLGDEPRALSFMNNPEQSWGTRDFFGMFEYRFSDRELRFLRHAPSESIQMGGPRYGDAIADRLLDSQRLGSSPWLLETNLRRRSKVFDFLEPVIVDLRLTNQSDRPQVIDENLFREGRNLNVAIRHEANPAALVRPHVIRCLGPKWRVVHPGESLDYAVPVSVGISGWHISEPGPYQVSVALNAGAVQAFSEPVGLRVATPASREEENIAQDFFTDDVGRALILGGAAEDTAAHATLENIVDRFSESRVARHALLALALPKMRPCKKLCLADGERPMTSASSDGGSIEVKRARVEDARRLVERALREGDELDTFGTQYLRRITELVKECLGREHAATAK